MIELLFLVLFPLIGSLVPVFTARWSRSYSALATAFLPVAALVLVLQLAPAVFSGETLFYTLPWVETLGLSLSFRLDGLSLLFVLLILGIGLLVILYARYYLSEKDSMARFYGFLMLFMTAMLGIVLPVGLITALESTKFL